MKLALHGATGRMGRTVARLAAQSDDIEIVGAACHSEDPNLGQDIGVLAGVGNLGVSVGADLAAALLGADVVVDFSLPPALSQLVKTAALAGVPVVSGTTGITQEHSASFDEAARQIPLLWARNMSLGIELLSRLVEEAARRLGPEFDIEIVDTHHRRKVDCPSGTAKRLADAVQRARPDATRRLAREGQVGPRSQDEVGVFGLRGGDVIGDHTVHFFGPGERLELTHRATSRDLFAHGALRAARWIVGKPTGRYEIADVLQDEAVA